MSEFSCFSVCFNASLIESCRFSFNVRVFSFQCIFFNVRVFSFQCIFLVAPSRRAERLIYSLWCPDGCMVGWLVGGWLVGWLLVNF